MATPVWIVVCAQPPNLSGTTLGAMCPVAARQQIGTTAEFFQAPASAVVSTPSTLDPAAVAAVFSASFGVVLLAFLVARSAGTVLRFIRHG